jgi:hypothetical protein
MVKGQCVNGGCEDYHSKSSYVLLSHEEKNKQGLRCSILHDIWDTFSSEQGVARVVVAIIYCKRAHWRWWSMVVTFPRHLHLSQSIPRCVDRRQNMARM